MLSHAESCRTTQSHIKSSGVTRSHTESCSKSHEVMQSHAKSHGVTCSHAESRGVMQIHTESCGVTEITQMHQIRSEYTWVYLNIFENIHVMSPHILSSHMSCIHISNGLSVLVALFNDPKYFNFPNKYVNLNCTVGQVRGGQHLS
jgi:hypothetical protein